MGRTKNKKKMATKKMVQTRVVFSMYAYSLFMLLLMLVLGTVIYNTIDGINDTKIDDINNIMVIDNKKEFKSISSQQGTFDVLITGKITTYGSIKNKEVGTNLVYLRETTYNNESGEKVGEEVVNKSNFIKIYDMNFNTNKLMFIEPSTKTTKIENGLRTEYESVPKGTVVTIQGVMENGILKNGAKLYTTTSVDDVKKMLDTSSNPHQFIIMWILLTLILIYVPMVIGTKMSARRNKIDGIEVDRNEFSTKDISDISEKLRTHGQSYTSKSKKK